MRRGERWLQRAFKVLGDARRLAPVRRQPCGDLGMHDGRHRLRHRSQHRFGNQVVCEGRGTQHLRGFQFGPGIGEVDGTHLQHVGGQLGAEVLPAHRSAACQIQRARTQCTQPVGQQGRKALRQRGQRGQGRGLVAGSGLFAAFFAGALPQRFDGLQHEQGLAAADVHQGRCGAGQVMQRQFQRRQQLAHARLVQRRQVNAHGAGQRLQRLHPGRQRRHQAFRAQHQHPGQAGLRHRGVLQRLDAGRVGAVQVVDQHGRGAGLGHGTQQSIHRGQKAGTVQFAAQGPRVAQLRNQVRQLTRDGCCRCLPQLGQGRTHHPREQCVGLADVAGVGGRAQQAPCVGGVLGNEACLADAGFAHQHHGGLPLPSGHEGRAFGPAPHQGGWPQHRHGQRAAGTRRCRRRGRRALDG